MDLSTEGNKKSKVQNSHFEKNVDQNSFVWEKRNIFRSGPCQDVYYQRKKNSKVNIGCRRVDFLKWPYFRTSAILTQTFDLQNFVWEKKLTKLKKEPHIYLLRGFQNAQENRSNGWKNTEGGWGVTGDPPGIHSAKKKPVILRVKLLIP